MGSAFKEKNNIGKISISEGAIAQMVVSEIKKDSNNFYITNSKGKRTSKVYKTMGGSSAANIEVVSENNKISITAYLIIRFGMSIKKATDELTENIRRQIELATGQNPAKITLVITGVKSKKTAKRNIEVIKEYDI